MIIYKKIRYTLALGLVLAINLLGTGMAFAQDASVKTHGEVTIANGTITSSSEEPPPTTSDSTTQSSSQRLPSTGKLPTTGELVKTSLSITGGLLLLLIPILYMMKRKKDKNREGS